MTWDREFKDLSQRYYQLKAKREQLGKDLKETAREVNQAEARLVAIDKAHAVLRLVSEEVLETLRADLSNLVTHAIHSVFGSDSYDFEVIFSEKRGKIEARLAFRDGEAELDPLSASGGGVVDVAALGLRVSMWAASSPRSMPVFILDEPFKNASKSFQPMISAFLRELSEKLGVQFIIVTHRELLAANADRVFMAPLFSSE